MKIPITINGKKYTIKSIDELTTKEFIELSNIEDINIVKYISWQADIKLEDAFFAVTSKSIEKTIGVIPDIKKLKRLELNYIDYSKTIETLGQRHQIEESNLSGYELLVFILAVSQTRSMNIDDVNKLRDDYLDKPFYEILPAGFFFFKILNNGSKYGRNFLKRTIRFLRTLLQKKEPELIN